MENFFKTFFDIQEKEYLKDITNQNMNIKSEHKGVSLKSLESFLSKSDKYNKNKQYFKFIDSQFFLALYSHNKSKDNNENQNDFFDKTIKDFLNLLILNNFKEDLNINSIPFKIIIEEIRKIIEKSKIIKNKNNREENCLIKIKNNNSVCLRDIKNYIDFLKNFDGFKIDITFYDINKKNSVFVEFLTILENNEEGIKFGMVKTNNEIRSLSEFIGESENSKMQIGDIQDFINVCNFCEKYESFQYQK